MDQKSERQNSGLRFGLLRYNQPLWRTIPAEDSYRRSRNDEKDSYVHALAKLEQEDEEIPLPPERGPIVFRDGVFQIDMSRVEEKGDIDLELKKLIDSILKE
jgi:hypothetical protein